MKMAVRVKLKLRKQALFRDTERCVFCGRMSDASGQGFRGGGEQGYLCGCLRRHGAGWPPDEKMFRGGDDGLN
jgi:hypothetical protein